MHRARAWAPVAAEAAAEAEVAGPDRPKSHQPQIHPGTSASQAVVEEPRPAEGAAGAVTRRT